MEGPVPKVLRLKEFKRIEGDVYLRLMEAERNWKERVPKVLRLKEFKRIEGDVYLRLMEAESNWKGHVRT